VPTEAQSKPKGLAPGAALDPRARGMNNLARAGINSGRSTGQIIAAMKSKYPLVPETEWAAIAPMVNTAVQWRRETGRPYTGAINLETRTDGAPVETDLATREAMNRETIEQRFGKQDLTQGGVIGKMQRGDSVGPVDHVKEILRNIGDETGYERRGEKFGVLPIIGGADMLEQGASEIGKGNVFSGLGIMALGSLDFVTGGGKGKAASTLLDAAKLDELAAKAGEGFDRTGFLRSAADEALQAGGRVLLHTERGSIPIKLDLWMMRATHGMRNGWPVPTGG
jgi:hypothetical protein